MSQGGLQAELIQYLINHAQHSSMVKPAGFTCLVGLKELTYCAAAQCAALISF